MYLFLYNNFFFFVMCQFSFIVHGLYLYSALLYVFFYVLMIPCNPSIHFLNQFSNQGCRGAEAFLVDTGEWWFTQVTSLSNGQYNLISIQINFIYIVQVHNYSCIKVRVKTQQNQKENPINHTTLNKEAFYKSTKEKGSLKAEGSAYHSTFRNSTNKKQASSLIER